MALPEPLTTPYITIRPSVLACGSSHAKVPLGFLAQPLGLGKRPRGGRGGGAWHVPSAPWPRFKRPRRVGGLAESRREGEKVGAWARLTGLPPAPSRPAPWSPPPARCSGPCC